MSYRVLHVLDHSWPILSGYSIRSRNIVEGQRRCGLDPAVVTGPLHKLDDHAEEDCCFDGVRYWRTAMPSRLAQSAMKGRWMGIREAMVVNELRRRIGELLDKNRFDVVHAHSPALCGLAASLAAQPRNIPVVYEIRAFWEDAAVDQKKGKQGGVRYRLTHGCETHVAQRADAVVGIARHLLVDLESRGIDKAKLFHVPNGVDADKFSPIEKDTRLASEMGLDGSPVLGFIGSLYRYEGICWLVRAAAELHRSGSHFQLVIIGDGEDLENVRTAIREHGAENFVRTLGRVPHDEIRRYYSLMDIMIYPRLSVRLTELVTPLKPLEAMAQGKAVLASGVGALRELIDDQRTGYLFEPGDISDFCSKAKVLIDHASLRSALGQRARVHILEQKEWKVLARRYEAIYEHARRLKRI